MLQTQEVFEISVDSPGAPKYFVYKEDLAKKLKEKLDKEYGLTYKISFKKQQINKRNFSGFLTHYLFEIEQRKQKSIKSWCKCT